MKKFTTSVISLLVGAGVGDAISQKISNKQFNEKSELSNKHLSLFLLMNQWVKVKQEGKNIADYLKREGYKNIAIYGMSYVGETLTAELAETDIEIMYGIDRKADEVYAEFDILLPEDVVENVDAVIVTAISYYDEIRELLNKKLNCPILSLEDILYEI